MNSTLRPRVQNLRQELRTRLEALAVRSSKGESRTQLKEGLEEIEQLEKLIRLLNRPTLAQRRLLFVMGITLTAGLAWWLLLDRVQSTTVRAEIELAEASFTLADERVLLDGTNLSALDLSGLRSTAGSPTAIQFNTREGADGRLQALRISPVRLAAGSRVTISTSPLTGAPRIAFRGPAEAISVTVREPNDGALSLPPSRRELDTNTDREVVLDLVPPVGEPLDLAPQLQALDLAFDQVREEGRPGELPLVVSTILGGSLWLEDIEVERTLRKGEPLTMRSADERLILRSVRFMDGRWTLAFDGRADELETGFRDSRRSLMPTRGQWLQAQHGVWFFWGGTIYSVGLLYWVLRWFGFEI